MPGYTEQIAAYDARRASNVSAMDAIMSKAAEEGRTLDASEQEEFDTFEAENEQIDGHLKRLKVLEHKKVSEATPVKSVDSEKAGSEARGGFPRVQVQTNLKKGTLFARYAMALAAGRGSISDALAYAKRWDSQTPEVSQYIKAVAGSTMTGTDEWGSELVYPTNLASEFIELLRPATVLGRLTGIRQVPFNVRIPSQAGGSTVNWVGERQPKPVSDMEFSTIQLGNNKIAGIVVLTEELVRLSSPSAEEVVRRDLVEQIAAFMDAQFLDPSITVSSSRPASITQGVTPVTASGTDAEALYYDLNTAMAAFDNAEMGGETIQIVMRRNLARGISSLRNMLGQFEFSGMTPNGGTLMGMPVIVSNSAPASTLVIIKGDEILMADDGSVRLDASREATLDMAGGSSPGFSLYQNNCIGMRAERWVTWQKRRSAAVAMIGTASYGPEPVGT